MEISINAEAYAALRRMSLTGGLGWKPDAQEVTIQIDDEVYERLATISVARDQNFSATILDLAAHYDNEPSQHN